MARLNHVKSFRGTTKTDDGLLTCSHCGGKIKVGDGYRWWANRAPGSRGGYRRIRCMRSECTPTTAEMTPGRRGQWLGMQEGFERQLDDCETIEDVQNAAESIADEIEGFGGEFVESADNMEEGFGHATYQSDELRERGEAIQAVAEEMRELYYDEPEDEPEAFDEDAARAEVVAEMEADPDADPGDEADLVARLDTKRQEHEEENEPAEEAGDEALEAARDVVREKIYEVDV